MRGDEDRGGRREVEGNFWRGWICSLSEFQWSFPGVYTCQNWLEFNYVQFIVCQYMVHSVAKSWIRLKQLSACPHTHILNNAVLKRKGRLPWWYRGSESTCQSRGHGFDLWYRRVPRASGTTKPVGHSSPRTRAIQGSCSYQARKLLLLGSATGDVTAVRSPQTATRE